MKLLPVLAVPAVLTTTSPNVHVLLLARNESDWSAIHEY